MPEYELEMHAVMKALNASGALPHCIVTGSWAMYFYKSIFEDFHPRVETTDLDMYLPNPKSATAENLPIRLRELSYIRSEDALTGKTTFLSSSGFEIEFLTVPDRTMSPVVRVRGMSVGAEALPKMAPIGWNYIELEWEGMKVKVASPVSFVIQKLLINEERKPEWKKEKDLDAVRYVLIYVKASRKYNEELKESILSAPRKWKKAIIDTAAKNGIDLGL